MKLSRLVTIIFVLLALAAMGYSKVSADAKCGDGYTCWGSVKTNTMKCSATECETWKSVCALTGSICEFDIDCSVYNPGDTCIPTCNTYVAGSGVCGNDETFGNCDGSPVCQTTITYNECKTVAGVCTDGDLVTWNTGCCVGDGATPTPTPAPTAVGATPTPVPPTAPPVSCSNATLNGPATLSVGETQTYTATATITNANIDRVEFRPSPTGVVSPNVLIDGDSTGGFTANFAGSAVGSTTITASIYDDVTGAVICTATKAVTVALPTVAVTPVVYNSLSCGGTAAPTGWTGGTMNLNRVAAPAYSASRTGTTFNFSPVNGDSPTPLSYTLDFANSDANWYTPACAVITQTVNVGTVNVAPVFYIAPYLTVTPVVYASDTCTGTTAPVGWSGGSMQLLRGAVPAYNVTDASSPYSFTLVKGGSPPLVYSVIFNNTDPTWDITPQANPGCAGNTLTQTVAMGTTNMTVPFYLTQQANPWYQVVGGDGAANLGSLTAIVPWNKTVAVAGGASLPFGALIAQTMVSNNGSLGSMGTWQVNRSEYAPPNDNYLSIKRLFELGDLSLTPNSFNSPIANYGTIASAAGLASYSPTDPATDKAYYYSGVLRVTGITVNDAVKRTIFVDGNLNVEGNIVVPVGGFLSFVVSGNMVFEGGVSQADGVYVADGTITIQDGAGTATAINESPRQFNGRGTFVGWGGVTLDRDLSVTGVLENNTYAAERFVYRPDFLINAPEGFKRSGVEWQEVAPSLGTNEQ